MDSGKIDEPAKYESRYASCKKSRTESTANPSSCICKSGSIYLYQQNCREKEEYCPFVGQNTFTDDAARHLNGIIVEHQGEGVVTFAVKRRKKKYQNTHSDCSDNPAIYWLTHTPHLIFNSQGGPYEIEGYYTAKYTQNKIIGQITHREGLDGVCNSYCVTQENI